MPELQAFLHNLYPPRITACMTGMTFPARKATCAMQVHKPASLDNNHADIIFLRAYDNGVLMTETVLRMADKDKHR